MRPRCEYLFDLISKYAWRKERAELKQWLQKYPGYVAALVLILVVASFGWNLITNEKKHVEDLRFQVSANSTDYEIQLEEKTQRLTAALSHLEDNPRPKAPGEKQLLIGKFAKLEWNYESKNNGEGQSTPRHSIVEVRSVEQPLLERRKIFVTGEKAWHPIASGTGLEKQGAFLWRVIPAEIDSSRNHRDESNWGAYSVFSIYPSVYERIRVTKKIRIGSYNVEQVELEGKSSNSKDSTTEKAREGPSCVKPSDGLSDEDRNVLCAVIEDMRSNGMPNLKTVVTRYSNIDHKLLPDLEAGELDIAFGNISKAAYRKRTGIHFVEYAPSKPVLLTNDKKKRTEEIGRGDRICAVQGTVYEHVLGKIMKKTPGRYEFVVCQNTIDAVDRLLKSDVNWIVMMGEQTWKTEIEPKHGDKLYRNTRSELVNSVPKEKEYKIEGDAFAITDSDLLNAVCLALGKKNRDCQILLSPKSQKEELPSRIGS